MHTLLPELEGTRLSGRPVRFPEELGPGPIILIVGFTHGARIDVGAWKEALASRGITFLSLPTSAVDQTAGDMLEVARAMRSHLPREAWDGVIQIHRGGAALRRLFGWKVDALAKLVRVFRDGQVASSHDLGPYSPEALEALLR